VEETTSFKKMRLAEQKLYQSGRLVPKAQVKLDDSELENEVTPWNMLG
jgi:hypothetical protein